MQDTTKGKGGKAPARQPAQTATTDPLIMFAVNLADVLRVAREDKRIPASLYNGLADTWNDFLNELPELRAFHESEAYIHLALTTYMRQVAQK